VRYAEFRDQLEGALRDEGLFFAGADRRVEMIDLEDTVRQLESACAPDPARQCGTVPHVRSDRVRLEPC
jgi:hypothetical protein